MRLYPIVVPLLGLVYSGTIEVTTNAFCPSPYNNNHYCHGRCGDNVMKKRTHGATAGISLMRYKSEHMGADYGGEEDTHAIISSGTEEFLSMEEKFNQQAGQWIEQIWPLKDTNDKEEVDWALPKNNIGHNGNAKNAEGTKLARTAVGTIEEYNGNTSPSTVPTAATTSAVPAGQEDSPEQPSVMKTTLTAVATTTTATYMASSSSTSFPHNGGHSNAHNIYLPEWVSHLYRQLSVSWQPATPSHPAENDAPSLSVTNLNNVTSNGISINTTAAGSAPAIGILDQQQQQSQPLPSSIASEPTTSLVSIRTTLAPPVTPPSPPSTDTTPTKELNTIPRINLDDLNDVKRIREERRKAGGPTLSARATSRPARPVATMAKKAPSLSIAGASSNATLEAIKREKSRIKTNYERLVSSADHYEGLLRTSHHHHGGGSNRTITTIYQQLRRTPRASPTHGNHHSWFRSLLLNFYKHKEEPQEPQQQADTPPISRDAADSKSTQTSKKLIEDPPKGTLKPQPITTTTMTRSRTRQPDPKSLAGLYHHHEPADYQNVEHLQLVSTHKIREQQRLAAMQQAQIEAMEEAERQAMLAKERAVKAEQEAWERRQRRNARVKFWHKILRKPCPDFE